MNGLCTETAGIREETAPPKETKNGPMRKVIVWDDRKYGIDEFRSLIDAEPNDRMKDIMVLEALSQSLAELERIIRFGNQKAYAADECMPLTDVPLYPMTGTEKNQEWEKS
jgi:hypothetical protein